MNPQSLSSCRALALLICLAGCCGQTERPIDVSGEVIRGLESDDPDERINAAVAVGEMPSVPDDVVDALINVLDDDDVEVRLAAAEAVAALGEQGHFHLKALEQAYTAERDADVRRAYEQSFAAIAASEDTSGEP